MSKEICQDVPTLLKGIPPDTLGQVEAIKLHVGKVVRKLILISTQPVEVQETISKPQRFRKFHHEDSQRKLRAHPLRDGIGVPQVVRFSPDPTLRIRPFRVFWHPKLDGDERRQ